jgi:hypothetical protein
MTAYEMMCGANEALRLGVHISTEEQCETCKRLLSMASAPGKAAAFRRRMGASGMDGSMYPMYYIPPYEGGSKLRLVTGETPKTHLLAANHYELEILRLLALWSPNDPTVRKMVEGTLERMGRTCFGRFCDTGECVGASVAALRFMGAALPRDDGRIQALLTPLRAILQEPASHARTYRALPKAYARLALAEFEPREARADSLAG